MRVAYLSLSPRMGMRFYTADLASDVAAAGHDVLVVTSRPASAELYDERVTVRAEARSATAGAELYALNIRDLLRVARTILSWEPDVVHVSSPHSWNVALAAACRARGVPVCSTMHDPIPHPGQSRLVPAYYRTLLRTTDLVLVHGRRLTYGLRKVARRRLVVDLPLLHLPGGKSYERSVRAAQPPPLPDEAVFAFLGRNEPYKGLDVLAHAASLVVAARPGVRFVIAGTGRLGRGFESDHLSVIPQLTNPAGVSDLLSRSRALVLPYTSASSSALPAAAHAHGRAVVATSVGALPEAVLDGVSGLIVAPSAPKELAHALLRLIDDPLLATDLGARGRTRYLEQRASYAAGLLDMYARTRHRRRSRSRARVGLLDPDESHDLAAIA